MKRNLPWALPVLLLLPALAMAQSAFVGTWKADLNHNLQLPEKPDQFLLSHGTYQCQSCVPPYSVPADGQDHKVAGHPYFDTASVKIVDANTVEETEKKAGKTVTVTTTKAASDGKTLTYDTTDSSNSNGAPVIFKLEAHRVGKAPADAHAISGSWRATKFENVSDNGLLVTFALSGSTLHMTTPTGQSYSAPVDGTDSPFLGDPGQTSVSIKRLDNRSLEETDKRDGKVIGTAHLTVSDDGKIIRVAWKDVLHGTHGSFTYVKQ